MSRTSPYTLEIVIDRAKDRGLSYVSGQFASGQSTLVFRCTGCGVTQPKKARYVFSRTRGGCEYQPCSPRGKLTIGYLRSRGHKHGASLRSSLADEAIVLAKQDFEWARELPGEQTLVEPWERTQRRIAMRCHFFPKGMTAHLGRRLKRPLQPRLFDLDYAINYIVENDIGSWTVATTSHAPFTKKVIDLGLKDAVFDRMKWEHKNSYSGKSPEDLIRTACDLVETHGFKTLSELEVHRPRLVVHLRNHGLTELAFANFDVEIKTKWRLLSRQKAFEFVLGSGISSRSELHKELPGLYKRLEREGWLDAIALELKWGKLKDNEGRGWQSRPEVIVANLLIAAGVRITPHPRIKDFRGINGGAPIADMLVHDTNNKAVLVEIWAFATERQALENTFIDGSKYWQARLHKEQEYRRHNIRLCGIEGRLIYNDLILKGKLVKRGEDAFLRHACEQLRASDVNLSHRS